MRKFMVISKKEFNKKLKDMCNYEDIKLPKRSTKFSSRYDFIAPFDFKLEPDEIIKVPTGIKVQMENGEFLAILVRSSMGFKYNIRLCNQVGIIDADYYNNEDNEGHIFIALKNEGDKTYEVKKGDKYAQGIFMKYLITDDDIANNLRKGGIGSTNL